MAGLSRRCWPYDQQAIRQYLFLSSSIRILVIRKINQVEKRPTRYPQFFTATILEWKHLLKPDKLWATKRSVQKERGAKKAGNIYKQGVLPKFCRKEAEKRNVRMLPLAAILLLF